MKRNHEKTIDEVVMNCMVMSEGRNKYCGE
jgi:hypothetical protein